MLGRKTGLLLAGFFMASTLITGCGSTATPSPSSKSSTASTATSSSHKGTIKIGYINWLKM